jgi:transcriptional regulator with XRE-family HTH domain
MSEIEPVYKNLGIVIRHLRGKRGMTQEALAKHMGWTRTTVVNIEAGNQRFMPHDIVKLAAFFGITAEMLTKGMWK